jgi:chromosome segregation ATPase
MPREASITYEQVAAIADSIKASGGKPNPRQVRERHGSGSLGTIHKLFQQWEAGQARQIEASLALPPTLQRAILEFMDQELATARSELELKLMDAQVAANDLATENERQVAQIEALEALIVELQEEKAGLAGRSEQLENDLLAAREEAGRERQNAESARTELAKAQLRLEAMPILENENKRLLAALDAERTARTDAERRAAAAEAKASGLVDRLGDAQERQRESAADLAKVESERQRLASELGELQKEAKSAAVEIGKLDGVVGALQRQIEEQAALMHNVPPAAKS